MTRTLLKLAALCALASALCACNTMRGIGEDISAAGRTLSRAAGN